MNEQQTLEQTLADFMTELDVPLPLDLIMELMNQGILVDEFIASHIN